jgi:hypothetical protein
MIGWCRRYTNRPNSSYFISMTKHWPLTQYGHPGGCGEAVKDSDGATLVLSLMLELGNTKVMTAQFWHNTKHGPLPSMAILVVAEKLSKTVVARHSYCPSCLNWVTLESLQHNSDSLKNAGPLPSMVILVVAETLSKAVVARHSYCPSCLNWADKMFSPFRPPDSVCSA